VEPITAFREATRDWLQANCPIEMRAPPVEEERCWAGRKWQFSSEAQRVWFERMVAKRWTVPAWPVEFGGAGLSTEEALVLREEMARLRCRRPLDSLGIWMLGPALQRFGTEEQKRKFLPPIARGEVRWCQGYSEPEAGSDLANLRTRAEQHGDHFVINGSKIWTSFADQADWMFCLVRTDASTPKHGGISMVLIDMDTPGIVARPIRLIFGASHFCQVTLTDVRVPVENLVGPLNRGWDIAKYLLTQERGSIADNKVFLGEPSLGELAKRNFGMVDGRLDQSMLRNEIAAYEMDALALTSLLHRVAELRDSPALHPNFSSVVKFASAAVHQRKHELLVSIAGTDIIEGKDPGPLAAQDWLKSKGNTIEGGTSEIQLNIIARRILGLTG
jgi:acyl-CoA dehydrogenase